MAGGGLSKMEAGRKLGPQAGGGWEVETPAIPSFV